MMTSQKGRLGAFWGFLFKQETDLRPEKRDSGYKDGPQQDKQGRECIGMVRTFILFYPDRRKAYTGRPRILWGFSGFVCKQAVQGADAYKPADMPEIDYLVISHDHWDHLDYETVMQLKNRVDKVVCPLG